jgi:hypothetical protein
VKLFMNVDMTHGYPHPVLFGGDIESFLLEKSRVTHAADNERTFHVFYQMCKSLNPVQLAQLKIPEDWRRLRMLSHTNFDVPGSLPSTDEREWKNVEAALESVSVTEEEKQTLLRMLAAVLLFCEVELVEADEGEAVEIKNMKAVANLTYIFELSFGTDLASVLKNRFFVIDGKETPSPLRFMMPKRSSIVSHGLSTSASSSGSFRRSTRRFRSRIRDRCGGQRSSISLASKSSTSTRSSNS